MKNPMQSADKKAKKINTKTLVLCAVLCAAALTIFVIEAQIPAPLPIPGVKLGLSNVITLLSLVVLGTKEAFSILIVRIILGSIFIGQPSVLLYSAAGGLLSLAAEAVVYRLAGKKFIVEISVIGAMTHNAAQVCCAALITRSAPVLHYLPPLLIVAAITGTFCGICVMLVSKFDFGKFL